MARIRLLAWIGLSLCLASEAAAFKCPNLVILLDRSASMLDAPDNTRNPPLAQSKWGIATAALQRLIGSYDGKLPMGLAMFPVGTDEMGNYCGTADLMTMSSRIVAPAYGTTQRIINALNNIANQPDPGAQTPTCTAIQKLAQSAFLQDASHGEYILLITDGEPNCVTCGAANALDGTVAALNAARMQSPPIKTFVVGFGQLPAQDKIALDMMAAAGGVPNSGPNYYVADNDDHLRAALDTIIQVVITGETNGTTTCDDSCYAQPCAAGQICVQGICKTSPCAGLTCAAGQYCYTDGAKGVCSGVCAMSCAAGTSCMPSGCQPDPCSGACGAGQRCNAASGACEADPACANVKCRSAQGCIASRCVDDPCGFITCPSGTTCIAFVGSCAGMPDAGGVQSGCSCHLTGRAGVGLSLIPIVLLPGLLLLRRRRRCSR